jgi:hypothetical protein
VAPPAPAGRSGVAAGTSVTPAVTTPISPSRPPSW